MPRHLIEIKHAMNADDMQKVRDFLTHVAKAEIKAEHQLTQSADYYILDEEDWAARYIDEDPEAYDIDDCDRLYHRLAMKITPTVVGFSELTWEIGKEIADEIRECSEANREG